MIEDHLINRDHGILGGTPVFMGTRVPVQTLLAGHPLDEFLDDFPTVTSTGGAETITN